MSYARRTDANHKLICDALKACGWQVEQTFRLRGGWDAVAWRWDDPSSVRLIEIKTAYGKPTAAQERLAKRGCPTVTLRTVEDVVMLQ